MKSGLFDAMIDVAEFHKACDIPILAKCGIPDAARVELRINLIQEEVNRELLPAMATDNLLKIADGMADAIYVIVGAALEYGIPLHRVWELVQAANMAKRDPMTGKVYRRADGKVTKPPGWVSPDADIMKVLAEAMK